MAARIVLAGRLAWGSLGAGTARATPRVVRVDPLDDHGNPVLGAPVYRREGPVMGVPWEDETGVRYRVVQRLDPAEGWVSAATIMRWYAVPYATVIDWLVRGLLDGAIEVCSPSKKYRVLDPHKIQAAMAAAPPAPKRRARR